MTLRPKIDRRKLVAVYADVDTAYVKPKPVDELSPGISRDFVSRLGRKREKKKRESSSLYIETSSYVYLPDNDDNR